MPKGTYQIARGGITRVENGETKYYGPGKPAGDRIVMDTEIAKKEIFANRLVPMGPASDQDRDSDQSFVVGDAESKMPRLEPVDDTESAADLLDGSPLDIIDSVRKITDPDQLQALRAEESNGKKRKSILNAIDSRLQEL